MFFSSILEANRVLSWTLAYAEEKGHQYQVDWVRKLDVKNLVFKIVIRSREFVHRRIKSTQHCFIVTAGTTIYFMAHFHMINSDAWCINKRIMLEEKIKRYSIA
jgi:hypothetical protein